MNLFPDEVQVGHELPTLTLPKVDRALLALFSGASGDHNPMHIDIDFARSSGMPDVFAQGMLGMAWLGRLITHWATQEKLRSFDARFQGMIQLGNILTCHGRVVEKLVYEGTACVRIEVCAIDQYGETKIIGEALVALAG
jgi:acyl dehydratase